MGRDSAENGLMSAGELMGVIFPAATTPRVFALNST